MQFDGRELHAAAERQRALETHGVRQRKRRHHLLDIAHHEIDQHAFHAAEHLAHAGDDDMFHGRLAQHLLQGMGKVFQHDDRFAARVVELVFQLARRVQRIDIDHRVAGAQHGRDRHRILQHIGHHQRHARTLFQAPALQKGAQLARIGVEFGIGQKFVHADIGIAIRIFCKRFFEQVHQRTILIGIDVGGYAGRIRLQPNFFHAVPLVSNNHGGAGVLGPALITAADTLSCSRAEHSDEQLRHATNAMLSGARLPCKRFQQD